jgi:hypothetical protein
VDQGLLRLSVLVAHCDRSVIEHNGKRLTLFPRTVESLVHAARRADLLSRIELVIADWPDVPQLSPLAEWLPCAVAGTFPYRVIPQSGPFNKGAALNQLTDLAACDRLFFLDCDMLVPAEVLTRGVAYLSEGKAWFPGYQARSERGRLSPPSTPRHGTGNAFMLRADLLRRGGWPSKETWGQFDRPVSDWFQREGLSAENLATRKWVPGFEHMWHPTKHGWNGRGRGYA